MTARPLSRAAIFAQAWPIILGQTTVPLVGLADTVVIGRTGDAAALAGVALGTTVINFLFWTFGFLRMGMTGMTAQALGADDSEEVRAMLVRGLALGLGIGAALFALQWLLIPAAFALLAGGEALDASAKGYVAARFWGAPASLGVFAINGWLLGLGRTRAALLLQIVMNLINAALDILFVWRLGMGAGGVGLGTAIAEWAALATGLGIAVYVLGPGAIAAIRTQRASLFTAPAIRRLFAVNANIMIRTIALLLMFAWFANAGARLGTVPLAANQVLMQFVSISAFVLDGFAFTAESRIGGAIGRGSHSDYLRAIRLTGEFTFGAGLIFALLIWISGVPVIAFVTDNQAVRATAGSLLHFTALVPLIGAPAWLLDGIFIGATEGRALRNSAVVATAAYVLTDLALRPMAADGVWIALLSGYAYRALALGCYMPRLTRSIAR
ncbi:MATE family efflux transporter [Stakelama pacifica]|uniref:MATE family multidrug resistance protein n=1 Tax=Stakelama pacifica TaxID=517720 RepID=A0A4R6FUS4_9SPHN|nr:MATE family efflux transporter [Stakelama pacifica]TDN85477.1 MATE family multidrug resistance protein [Stakelama pacifica]GGO92537.1 MATE family efflux transporter [Stakelama pacifica]